MRARAVRLPDGRSAFAKTWAAAPPGFFRTEAAGLEWLGEAPGGAPVPRVLRVADDMIVLELVATARPTAEAAERLGRELAATHAAGAEHFGGQHPAWIGPLPMPNRAWPDWPTLFAEGRVLPFLRRAVDGGAVTTADARAVEAVCARLPELAGPAEPPARVHGDLWSGNLLWAADGRVRLADPAAHGGHREGDLAMLALFGAPHLERILAAYAQASPLADGWTERVALHQLHPVLVHAVLFGGAYGAQAGRLARSALQQLP